MTFDLLIILIMLGTACGLIALADFVGEHIIPKMPKLNSCIDAYFETLPELEEKKGDE